MPEIYALIVKKKDIFKMNVHKFFMKIITIRKSNIIKSEQIINLTKILKMKKFKLFSSLLFIPKKI